MYNKSWLKWQQKDYCQKALPAKYREGWKEYFGKKGMILHVGILFLNKNHELVKQVYFPTVYRCDQGIIDSLCLAIIALDKMKKDFPNLEKLYAKPDIVSSYHFYIETLYQLCCEIQIKLKRYDYSEPCCGKDKCACEFVWLNQDKFDTFYVFSLWDI